MVKPERILQKILAGSKNIPFQDALKLAHSLGFKLDRIKASHHILIHDEIPELLNLQNAKGQVKPYQLKQLIDLIDRYNLKIED